MANAEASAVKAYWSATDILGVSDEAVVVEETRGLTRAVPRVEMFDEVAVSVVIWALAPRIWLVPVVPNVVPVTVVILAEP